MMKLEINASANSICAADHSDSNPRFHPAIYAGGSFGRRYYWPNITYQTEEEATERAQRILNKLQEELDLRCEEFNVLQQ